MLRVTSDTAGNDESDEGQQRRWRDWSLVSTGTDPALGPRILFLAATIAGGFAAVAIVLAVTLSDSSALAVVAGGLPVAILFVAAYDYGDRASPTVKKGISDPNSGVSSQQMTDPHSQTHSISPNTNSGGQRE